MFQSAHAQKLHVVTAGTDATVIAVVTAAAASEVLNFFGRGQLRFIHIGCVALRCVALRCRTAHASSVNEPLVSKFGRQKGAKECERCTRSEKHGH